MWKAGLALMVVSSVPRRRRINSGADWRWLQDRRDSPWYPTARLFRQTTMGDWAPVLAAVRTALNPR